MDCQQALCQKLDWNVPYMPGRDYESRWTRLILVPKWLPGVLRPAWLYLCTLPRTIEIEEEK